MSFKTKVAAFWQWFSTNTGKIEQAITDHNTGKIMPELAAELEKVFGQSAFMMGKGQDDYELILSPEGSLERFMLYRYWQEAAPKLPGWTFFRMKPPALMDGVLKLEEYGIEVCPDDLLVSAVPNEESRKLDITVYCEKIEGVEDQGWYLYAFLMIDNAIGEGYTETAIGAIDKAAEAKETMIPLSGLYPLIETLYKEKAWELAESPDLVLS